MESLCIKGPYARGVAFSIRAPPGASCCGRSNGWSCLDGKAKSRRWIARNRGYRCDPVFLRDAHYYMHHAMAMLFATPAIVQGTAIGRESRLYFSMYGAIALTAACHLFGNQDDTQKIQRTERQGNHQFGILSGRRDHGNRGDCQKQHGGHINWYREPTHDLTVNQDKDDSEARCPRYGSHNLGQCVHEIGHRQADGGADNAMWKLLEVTALEPGPIESEEKPDPSVANRQHLRQNDERSHHYHRACKGQQAHRRRKLADMVASPDIRGGCVLLQ